MKAAWAVQSIHISAYALLAASLLLARGQRLAPGPLRQHLPALLVCLLPVWGLVQLYSCQSTSPPETRTEVLHWFALAAVFFVARAAGSRSEARRAFLKLFLGFATAMAVLCLLQLFTSQGRVLWIFPTGEPDVYGTFPSYNSYAQFIELALPVALWWAARNARRDWGFTLAAGVLYASVIGSTSRAGSVLATVELLVFLVLWSGRGLSLSRGLLVVTPVALTLAVGWERLWERFRLPDPYFVRREYLEAALDMVREHPWMGLGLGAFPVAAPAFAVRDFPFYANHVHNDWLEFAAEGGIFFAVAVLVIFAVRVPAILRHPWSIGLIAVGLHAFVDYPFPRVAVSGWIFALLGLVDAARVEELKGRPGTSAPELSIPVS